MNPTLRKPEPLDYEAIASWVPDAQSCFWWAGPRMKFPFTAAVLPSLLTFVGAQGQSYCLAEGTVSPLGFGQHWVVKPGAVHLARIIIAPSARGRGIGRLFFRLLAAQAIQATGAEEVTLRVYRQNAVALSLYSSLGFSTDQAESTEEILFMRAEAKPLGGENGGQTIGSLIRSATRL